MGESASLMDLNGFLWCTAGFHNGLGCLMVVVVSGGMGGFCFFAPPGPCLGLLMPPEERNTHNAPSFTLSQRL